MFSVFQSGWLPDADHGTPVGSSPSSASYGYEGSECCAWCQQQFPSSNVNYVDYKKGQECRCWALTGAPQRKSKGGWLWGPCSAPAGRRKRSEGNSTVVPVVVGTLPQYTGGQGGNMLDKRNKSQLRLTDIEILN